MSRERRWSPAPNQQKLPLEELFTLALIHFQVRPWGTYCRNVRTFWRLCAKGQSARTAERLRRSAAFEIVLAATGHLVPRRALQAAVADFEAFGSSIEKRVTVACSVAQWTKATRNDSAWALRLIAKARRHLESPSVKPNARESMSIALDLNERLLRRAKRLAHAP